MDGVIPSNEGRGYVLRRIIRRAIRHGYAIGGKTPFFYKLVNPLVQEMGQAYPELAQREKKISSVLKQEEERFSETLEQGMRIFEAEIGKLKTKQIPGELVFRLYDTYGFPVDLTADVGRERGLEVDMDGFEQAMAAQREQARAASQFKADINVAKKILETGETVFTGYQSLSETSVIKAISQAGSALETLNNGEQAIIILDRTPFYAESGGQVGDVGVLKAKAVLFEINDTQNLGGGVIGHFGRLIQGERLAVNEQVEVQVEAEVRARTMRNHSATHLLHAALKQVLGNHVEQKGSLVAGNRLRFDFSHSEPVTDAELTAIENLVNREIRSNSEVGTRVMPLEQAKASGAEALFGEKYDDNVRVVNMGDFSFELCGGTHVARTGDIGLLLIINETGIAAGVRRIEAVTGVGALEYVQQQFKTLDDTANLVRGNRTDVTDKVTQLMQRLKQLEKEKEQLQRQLTSGGGPNLLQQARERIPSPFAPA